MIVIATGFLSLSSLSVVSAMAMWEKASGMGSLNKMLVSFFIFGQLLCTVPSQVHPDFSSSKASDPTFYVKMHLHLSDQLDKRKRFIP